MTWKFYYYLSSNPTTYVRLVTFLYAAFCLLLVHSSLLPLPLHAQSRRVDSLTGLLATSLPDTQRINTLCELSNNLLAYKPEKARDYAIEALQLAEKWDYLEGKAQALLLLGTIAWKQNPKGKNNYLQRALKIAQSTDNQLVTYKTTAILKDYYRAKKQYDSALYFYDINIAAEEILFDKDKARIVKALADELHNEALKQKEIEWLQKENAQKQALIEQQNLVKYSLMAGFALLTLLGFMSYKYYRQKELLKFNKQMEEIGDIASHQLRNPVASIQGLMAIYNRENLADPENKVILSHLDQCVQKLDTLTREIVKKTYLS